MEHREQESTATLEERVAALERRLATSERRRAAQEEILADLIAGNLTLRYLTFADAAGVARVVMGVEQAELVEQDVNGEVLVRYPLRPTPEAAAAERIRASLERERRHAVRAVERARGAASNALRHLRGEMAQRRLWVVGRDRLRAAVDEFSERMESLRALVDREPWPEGEARVRAGTVLVAEAEGVLAAHDQRLAEVEGAR